MLINSVDLTPTILGLLRIPSQNRFDGVDTKFNSMGSRLDGMDTRTVMSIGIGVAMWVVSVASVIAAMVTLIIKL